MSLDDWRVIAIIAFILAIWIGVVLDVRREEKKYARKTTEQEGDDITEKARHAPEWKTKLPYERFLVWEPGLSTEERIQLHRGDYR